MSNTPPAVHWPAPECPYINQTGGNWPSPTWTDSSKWPSPPPRPEVLHLLNAVLLVINLRTIWYCRLLFRHGAPSKYTQNREGVRVPHPQPGRFTIFFFFFCNYSPLVSFCTFFFSGRGCSIENTRDECESSGGAHRMRVSGHSTPHAPISRSPLPPMVLHRRCKMIKGHTAWFDRGKSLRVACPPCEGNDAKIDKRGEILSGYLAASRG